MLSFWQWAIFLGLITFGSGVHCIGQQTCVAFQSSSSTFPIVTKGQGTPVFLSADEWPGVQRAATDFVSDIQQVTGVKSSLTNVTVTGSTVSKKASSVIIVGTLGKSSLVDQVVSHAKLDVSSVEGQWEAFFAKQVKNPLPGIDSAYVIIGADKRGTIYGLYDHSEQFGTWRYAPFQTSSNALIMNLCGRCIAVVLVRRTLYCDFGTVAITHVVLMHRTRRWADVPTTKHSELHVTASGCSH